MHALEACANEAVHGRVELYFTYDEEFGGELGPGWLLREGLVRPDLVMAAGFSYEVIKPTIRRIWQEQGDKSQAPR